MRLSTFLLILAIGGILLAGCKPTPTPTPTETIVPTEPVEIFIGNANNGNVYGYDWDTMEMTARTFVGEIAGMTISENGRYLYVICDDERTLSIINTETFSVEKTTVLQETPLDIMYLRNSHSICVASQSQKAILLLSTDDLRVVGTLQLNGYPRRLVCSSDGNIVYVTVSAQLGTSPTLLIAMDTQDGEILDKIEIMKGNDELAIPWNGDHIYITYPAYGSITVVDTETMQIETSFENITKVQFPNAVVGGATVSPNDEYLYFYDSQSDYIRAIELPEGKIAKEITLKRLSDIFITSSGRYLFAVYQGWFDMHNPSNKTPGSLYIIDIDSWQVIHQFDVEFGSAGVVTSPSL